MVIMKIVIMIFIGTVIVIVITRADMFIQSYR